MIRQTKTLTWPYTWAVTLYFICTYMQLKKNSAGLNYTIKVISWSPFCFVCWDSIKILVEPYIYILLILQNCVLPLHLRSPSCHSFEMRRSHFTGIPIKSSGRLYYEGALRNLYDRHGQTGDKGCMDIKVDRKNAGCHSACPLRRSPIDCKVAICLCLCRCCWYV